MDRRSLSDTVLRLGWTLSSAEADALIVEACGRLQMTAWFVHARLGLLVLHDIETETTLDLPGTAPVPAPAQAIHLLGAQSTDNSPRR